jgi:hypothetical protein
VLIRQTTYFQIEGRSDVLSKLVAILALKKYRVDASHTISIFSKLRK